jgi:hypothetical protein
MPGKPNFPKDGEPEVFAQKKQEITRGLADSSTLLPGQKAKTEITN